MQWGIITQRNIFPMETYGERYEKAGSGKVLIRS